MPEPGRRSGPTPGPVAVPVPDVNDVITEAAAWPTGVPGLVIGQIPLDAPDCGGSWLVMHARSGRRLPFCLPGPEAARALAGALAVVMNWQDTETAVRYAMRSDAYLLATARFSPWKCFHGAPSTRPHDNGVIA